MTSKQWQVIQTLCRNAITVCGLVLFSSSTVMLMLDGQTLRSTQAQSLIEYRQNQMEEALKDLRNDMRVQNKIMMDAIQSNDRRINIMEGIGAGVGGLITLIQFVLMLMRRKDLKI